MYTRLSDIWKHGDSEGGGSRKDWGTRTLQGETFCHAWSRAHDCIPAFLSPLSSTKAAQIHCKKQGKPQNEKVRVQHGLRKRDWRHCRVWSSVQENGRTLRKPADDRAKAQLTQAGSVCPRAASSPSNICQALGKPWWGTQDRI